MNDISSDESTDEEEINKNFETEAQQQKLTPYPKCPLTNTCQSMIITKDGNKEVEI